MFPRTGLLFRRFVGMCVLIAQGLIRCSVFCALGPQCFQRDSTYYLLDSPWPLEPAEIFFFRYHLVVPFGQTFFQTYFRLLLRSFYVKEQGCSLRRERWVFAVVAPWANVTSTDWCIFNGWKFMLCCSSPGLNEKTPLLFSKYVLVCLLICRFCFHYLYKYNHKRKTYFKRLPCATFLRENSPVNVPRSLSNGERVLLKWQLKLINASAKVRTA